MRSGEHRVRSAQPQARPRLPPLAKTPESARGNLISGIRDLDASGKSLNLSPSAQGSACGGEQRSLHSISRFGLRANERAAEAECEFSEHDAARERGTSQGEDDTFATVFGDPKDVQRHFEQLVTGINSALAGGSGSGEPTRPLRKDEVITESLNAHDSKHYRIWLPTRPTAVTVAVTRISGVPPALWGSTSVERPSQRTYDFRSNNADKLVYEHVLQSDDGEESANVDRRYNVPSCAELFVTATAKAGECSFKLQVTMGHLKVVLTRSEIAAQVGKVRKGWEARLAELQREPAQMERFQEHVRVVSEERKNRKMKSHGGINFLDRNSRSLMDSTPRGKLLNLQKKALTGFARQDAAVTKKEELEQEKDRQMVAWLNRGEIRKREREEQEMKKMLENQADQWQRSWLTHLAMLAFSESVGMSLKEMRDKKQFMDQQVKSVTIIRKFIVRCLCKMRRAELYRNVIKMRLAIQAHTRVIRQAVACSQQPVIKGFLEVYAFHHEVPTIGSALARFRATVILVQRCWRRQQRIRQAYQSVLWPYWMAAQLEAYRERAKQHLEQETMAAQAESDLRKAATSHLIGMTKGKSRSSVAAAQQPERAKTSSTLRRPSDDGKKSLSAFDLVDKTMERMDMIPKHMVRVFLNGYIVSMQRSYTQRLEAWEKARKDDEFAKDLEGFGVRDEAGAKGNGKPKSVYIDEAEIQQVVLQTTEDWASDKYKHVRANRARLMVKPFKAWKELWKRKLLGKDGPLPQQGQKASASPENDERATPSPTFLTGEEAAERSGGSSRRSAHEEGQS